jgi:hypothetical protein
MNPLQDLYNRAAQRDRLVQPKPAAPPPLFRALTL